MKLVLHIGTEKTGTTALQGWLHRNDAALAERGVVYSRSLGRPPNRRIATYGRPADRPDESFETFGIADAATHAAFRRTVEEALVREVEEARAAGARIFAISSEHLHSRIVTDAMAETVARLLAPLFEEIAIVLVVRPPVDLAVSAASTAARSGVVVDGAHLLARHETSYFDYPALVRRWERVFPGALSVVPYKRRPDTVATFCEILDVDGTALERPIRRNEALSADAIALNNTLLPLPRPLARLVVRRLGTVDDGRPLTLSRAEAEALHARFAPSVEDFCRMVEGVTPEDLTPDWERYPETGNLDALAPAGFGGVLRGLLADLAAEATVERARAELAEAEIARLGGWAGRARRLAETARATLAEARAFAPERFEERIAALEATAASYPEPATGNRQGPGRARRTGRAGVPGSGEAAPGRAEGGRR